MCWFWWWIDEWYDCFMNISKCHSYFKWKIFFSFILFYFFFLFQLFFICLPFFISFHISFISVIRCISWNIISTYETRIHKCNLNYISQKYVNCIGKMWMEKKRMIWKGNVEATKIYFSISFSLFLLFFFVEEHMMLTLDYILVFVSVKKCWMIKVRTWRTFSKITQIKIERKSEILHLKGMSYNFR